MNNSEDEKDKQIKELEEHLFTCQGMLLEDQKKLAEAEDKFNKLQAHHAEVYSRALAKERKAGKLVEALLTIIGVHTQAYASVVAENALKEYRGEK